MIIAVGGGVRTGKTLLITILGYIGNQRGVDIYSNYKTTFSELINPVNILDFELEKCFLLLDEAQTIIDSRSNKQVNRLISYFISQSGKRDVSILWTSQLLGAVDLRLRELSHILIFAQKLERVKRFKYTITDRVRYKTSFIPFDKAEKFYDLYDTYEKIYPLELSAEGVINFDEIIDLFNDSPTKKSFVMLLRKDNPFLTYDIVSSCYDLIKNKKMDRAKKLLGLN